MPRRKKEIDPNGIPKKGHGRSRDELIAIGGATKIRDSKRAAELGKLGGAAWRKKCAEQKSIRERLLLLRDMNVKNKNTGEEMERGDLLSIVLWNKALGGDIKSIKLLLEMLGEYAHAIEVTGSEGKDLIPDSMADLMAQAEALRMKTEGITKPKTRKR